MQFVLSDALSSFSASAALPQPVPPQFPNGYPIARVYHDLPQRVNVFLFAETLRKDPSRTVASIRCRGEGHVIGSYRPL